MIALTIHEILTFDRHRHVTLHRPRYSKFYPNWMIADGVDGIPILQDDSRKSPVSHIYEV